MQAQFMALNTISNGHSVIEETVFENRFQHVDELKKMGADISLEKNKASVKEFQILSVLLFLHLISELLQV